LAYILIICFQQIIFNDLGLEVLDNAWKGYNTSLFAYGQTGSGKSYSMLGHGVNKGNKYIQHIYFICQNTYL